MIEEFKVYNVNGRHYSSLDDAKKSLEEEAKKYQRDISFCHNELKSLDDCYKRMINGTYKYPLSFCLKSNISISKKSEIEYLCKLKCREQIKNEIISLKLNKDRYYDILKSLKEVKDIQNFLLKASKEFSKNV